MNPVIDVLMYVCVLISLALLVHYVRNILNILDDAVHLHPVNPSDGEEKYRMENPTDCFWDDGECPPGYRAALKQSTGREAVLKYCSFIGAELDTAMSYIQDAEDNDGYEVWENYESIEALQDDVQLYIDSVNKMDEKDDTVPSSDEMDGKASWHYFLNDPSGIIARLFRIEYVAPYDVDAQGERTHELMYESFKIEEQDEGDYHAVRLRLHTPEMEEFNPHGSDVDPWMIECRHDNKCEYPNAVEVHLYVEPGEYHQIGVINLTFTGDAEVDTSEYLRKALHMALYHSIITEEIYPYALSQ